MLHATRLGRVSFWAPVPRVPLGQHAFGPCSRTCLPQVARTIAGLAGGDRSRLGRVSEAIQYRSTELHFRR